MHFEKVAPKVVDEITDRHAPGFVNGRRPSGYRDVLKMSNALKAFIASHEHLSAPDLAVSAVTRSVQGKADNSSFEVVFCHAAGDVGVMVLHSNQRQVSLQCPFSREIVRMEIPGDHLGLDLQNPLEVLNRLLVQRRVRKKKSYIVVERCNLVCKRAGMFIMTDTGERREIKARTGAKEAEIVAESKKLLQKSMAATGQALGIRRRVIEKETLPTNR